VSAHANSELGRPSSGADTLSLGLLGLSFVGAIIELFFEPFVVALPLLVITMVAIRVSDRYRRIGLIALSAIILCFMIGASFAVWDSRQIIP
jgi:hypothetical protein